jgi:hypothetical protein
MIRRLRFVALTAAVALTFSACADNDAKESDVVNAMQDAGLPTDQAECIGAAVDDAFGDDQSLYNDIAGTADPAEFPPAAQDELEAILDDCIDGEGTADDPATDDGSTDGEDGADDADTTDTTDG